MYLYVIKYETKEYATTQIMLCCIYIFSIDVKCVYYLV